MKRRIFIVVMFAMMIFGRNGYGYVMHGVLRPAVIFTVGSVAGNANEEVLVPVTVVNFDSVDSFGFSISWDHDIATFVSPENLHPDLFVSQVGQNIQFFFQSNLVSLPDNSVIGYLRFRLSDQAGETTPLNVSQAFVQILNYQQTDNFAINSGSIAINPFRFHFYGLVEYVNAAGLRAATVSVSGAASASDTTDQYGNYDLNFSPSATGSPRLDLFVTKYNDTQPLNGIDMIDVELIRDFIESPEKTFSHADQVIAADVDPDNVVNENDAQVLEDMILGVSDLNDEKRWTFRVAGQVFSDPYNPFPYQSDVTILDYHTSPSEVYTTFIGIKRGDVDFDRDNSQGFRKGTEQRHVKLEVVSIDTQDEIVEVQVRTFGFTDIRACQFTLNWNAAELELYGSQLPEGTRESAQRADEGSLSILWSDRENKSMSLNDQSTLMTWYFHKKVKGNFNPVAISGSYTEAKMFDTNLQPVNLILAHSLSTETPGDMKFYPNPFSSGSSLNIRVAEDQMADFSVMNADGKIVSHEKILLQKGNNKIVQDGKEMSPGVYIFKVMTKQGFIVNKVMKK